MRRDNDLANEREAGSKQITKEGTSERLLMSLEESDGEENVSKWQMRPSLSTLTDAHPESPHCTQGYRVG